MSSKRVPASASRQIVQLSRGQYGVVCWRQLRRLGVTRSEMRNRVDDGWLTVVHRGVYAVGGQPLSHHGWWIAAVFACGDTALLSHRAAAALWGLTRVPGGAVDVTIDGRAGRRRRRGIVVHRPRIVTDAERSEHEGIPVTAPDKTILDLAATRVSRRALERAVDEAERLGLCDASALLAVAERPRPGARRLLALLREHSVGSNLTRSELEERFLALCRRQAWPEPLVNAELLDLTVDFFWPGAGLVVEVDGRGSHDTRRGFQADRDRDSRLAVAGFRTLRFTWWDVTRRPAVVAHRVSRLLTR